MPLFYIGMGQGIIGRADLRVRTSKLEGCVLIAGYNPTSGYGGAFHYPSGSRKDPGVLQDMSRWASLLAPTVITLVLTPAFSEMAGDEGTSKKDRIALEDWSRMICGVAPTKVSAVSAGMELLAGGAFRAGNIEDLAGRFDEDQFNVHVRGTGTYMDKGIYTLITGKR